MYLQFFDVLVNSGDGFPEWLNEQADFGCRVRHSLPGFGQRGLVRNHG
jgi:hypothetical protein